MPEPREQRILWTQRRSQEVDPEVVAKLDEVACPVSVGSIGYCVFDLMHA